MQLYVEQHKITHPEFEKHLNEIIGDMLDWYHKNIVPEMENFVINNRKYGQENIPKEIKDKLFSKKKRY